MGTVVVVEDEAGVRALVVAALTGAGYTVLEAADGDEGLRLTRTHRPQVVIADRRMPGMDGLRLAGAIKGDPALDGTRVVILSGDVADEVPARAAGADAYLAKPFRVTQLLEVACPPTP